MRGVKHEKDASEGNRHKGDLRETFYRRNTYGKGGTERPEKSVDEIKTEFDDSEVYNV